MKSKKFPLEHFESEPPPNLVSHVMPEESIESWKTHSRLCFEEAERHRNTASMLLREVSQLTSQLSTLQAQMKEVVKAGDEIYISYTCLMSCDTDNSKSWRIATASLRQSGHK